MKNCTTAKHFEETLLLLFVDEECITVSQAFVFMQMSEVLNRNNNYNR